MSKPWRPDEDVIRARFGAGKRLRSLDEFETPGFVGRMERLRRARKSLPPGATIALVLLGAACVGAAAGLYSVAGPIDVFERESGADWSAVDGAGR